MSSSHFLDFVNTFTAACLVLLKFSDCLQLPTINEYSRPGEYQLSGFFVRGINTSVAPTFYPLEARKRGATPSQVCHVISNLFTETTLVLPNAPLKYGFVFGIGSLVICLVSPMLAHCGTRIGSSLMMNGGNVSMSLCAILFGLQDYISDPNVFTCVSYILQ